MTQAELDAIVADVFERYCVTVEHLDRVDQERARAACVVRFLDECPPLRGDHVSGH